MKLILDLCGGTGAWSKPYADAGYKVLIVDPLVNGTDVRLFERIDEPVHGVLAAPPCTHLAGSGARWWAAKGEAALLESLSVVDACLRVVAVHSPAWWVMENPVGRLPRFIGKPKMYFNPCDYGDPYTKKTALWGEFTEPKKNPVEPEGPNPIFYAPPSPDRWKIRSVTPAGFARAFFEANP